MWKILRNCLGEKYIVGNIFFKFAEDVKIDSNTTLYGSIENALKSTDLELKGKNIKKFIKYFF